MRSIRNASWSVFALAIAASLAAQTPERVPQTYGTSVTSYIEVPAEAFFPLESDYGYHNGTGSTRYSSNCAGFACLAAPLQLPSGAKIVYLELDFVDTTPTDSVNGTFAACDYLGQNCNFHPNAGAGPVDCAMPFRICSGVAFASGGGQQAVDLHAEGITVNNFTGSYRLFASAPSSGAQLAGMIVGYVLQVSPAPGTADFNDVPTSHPFFQYIEALYHSGITGGCQASPPMYCPDAPLTRGQMAVFLAKGLGLQFP